MGTVPKFSADLAVSRRRLASLFDFGKETGLEILAASAFIFGQPRLEQTPEAKSAGHTEHAATVRALVRFMRAKRISKAEETHLRKIKSQERRERDAAVPSHIDQVPMGRSGVAKARRPRRPDVVSNGLPCISTSTETGGQSSKKFGQMGKNLQRTMHIISKQCPDPVDVDFLIRADLMQKNAPVTRLIH
jgi:hypothetical protein